MTIHVGDCRVILAGLEPDSLDACVTDPPYGLEFMGKEWDAPWKAGFAQMGIDGKRMASPSFFSSRNPVCRTCHKHRRGKKCCMCAAPDFDEVPADSSRLFQRWSEEWARAVLRVLKPGGHLLAFGGTRTYHRMACAIEDAGFEVRDSLHWIYGSGFPKSLNVGDGRGTALKPAHEPIILARKPLVGTVAGNVLRYGTGAINVDRCRVEGPPSVGGARGDGLGYHGAGGQRTIDRSLAAGRWPPNVLLDEAAAEKMDAQSGHLHARGNVGPEKRDQSNGVTGWGCGREPGEPWPGDSGGASRFFPVFRYEPKPARAERDRGLRNHAPRTAGEATDREENSAGLSSPRAGAGRTGGARNFHPTVKPVALMRWLVRLVTPPGGTVLDPFTGSGTTGCAAAAEGFSFLGCELDPEYAELARARIAKAAATGHQPDLFAEGA